MTTAIVILTLACPAGSWGRQIQPSQQAGAARVNGNVVVSVVIDERGDISQAKAVSGHELLILSALRAARQCLFAPALRDGLPVKVRVTLEFPFYIY